MTTTVAYSGTEINRNGCGWKTCMRRIHMVRPSKKAPVDYPVKTVPSTTVALTDEMEDLREQIRELKATLSTRNSNINRNCYFYPTKFCAYCLNSSHDLSERWRKQVPSLYFDCCQTNGRRRNPPISGEEFLATPGPGDRPQLVVSRTFVWSLGSSRRASIDIFVKGHSQPYVRASL